MIYRKRTVLLIIAMVFVLLNIGYQYQKSSFRASLNGLYIPVVSSDSAVYMNKPAINIASPPISVVQLTVIEKLHEILTAEEILNLMSRPALFDRVTQTIQEPPIEKRIWAKPSNARLSVAIVEPREHENLRGVLFNMAHVYGGTNTSLYIFHGTKNLDFVKKQIPDWQDVQYVNLGVESLAYPAGYNILMQNESVYLNFKSEFVLIFQTDTLIRHAIPEHLFSYDYVGAPWAHNPLPGAQSQVGNGGFSLRRVSAMLEICKRVPATTNAEDLYFAANVNLGGLPTAEVAKDFAAEMQTAVDPVGFHQIYKYLGTSEMVRLLSGVAGVRKLAVS